MFTEPAELLAALEAAGSPQCRKIYEKHGVTEPTFGVSYAEQKKLAKLVPPSKKKKGRNQAWATALWNSGNHDARVLATMIAEAEEATTEQLEGWINDVANYVLADAFTQLAAQVSDIEQRAFEWTKSPLEYRKRIGYTVFASLFSKSGEVQEWPSLLLPKIEAEVHGSPNHAREGMNNCLIAIGGLTLELRELALEVSSRLGPIEVDHGDTNCKTFVVDEYIDRIWQRKTAIKTANK